MSLQNLPSTIFTLKFRDFLKGAILAILAPILVALQESLAAEHVVINWAKLGMVAVAAFIAYLGKNFFTDDTAAAVKTVQEAQEKKIEKQKLPDQSGGQGW